MPTATLLGATILSCDIAPEASATPRTDEIQQEIKRRLTIAVAHATSGRLPMAQQSNYSKVYEGIVELERFAAWAQKHTDFSLPQKFPGVVQRALATTRVAPAAAGARWPWGTYETPLLKELAAAVQYFWTDYKPESAATKPEVIAWLKARGRTLNEATRLRRSFGIPTSRTALARRETVEKGDTHFSVAETSTWPSGWHPFAADRCHLPRL